MHISIEIDSSTHCHSTGCSWSWTSLLTLVVVDRASLHSYIARCPIPQLQLLLVHDIPQEHFFGSHHLLSSTPSSASYSTHTHQTIKQTTTSHPNNPQQLSTCLHQKKTISSSGPFSDKKCHLPEPSKVSTTLLSQTT